MDRDQIGKIRRIAVLGSSGSGKSTLSVLLGEKTGLPVIHLDKEHWRPGWTEPDRDEWHARLAGFADRPEWIIDGQYGALLGDRLRRADLAIFIDLPTATCLWRMVKRTVATHGRVRPDMGEGCPERFDAEFIHYIATFRRLQRPKVLAALDASRVPCVWLESARAQNAFSATVRRAGLPAALSAAIFRARS